ncbi:hypothetical protein BJY16_001649 [Actinoplanes octamycinicus]|uniref:Ig-like domain-containing protein n=1 Tax=Actinoplanes octamycinicus TaxID=135948 RepID=A0A7W7GTU1_9ACTN|nr:ATP/GTP-binding protein [Actinoplanes octamycinicus]MBB4738190.1 hypothetical protein [Actinoplanes octamycinicus]
MSGLGSPALAAEASSAALTTRTGSAALAAGSGSVAADGAVVVPAAERAVPRATQVLNAGATGFLWIQEGDDRLFWTEYATGVTTALPQRLSATVKYDVYNGYFSFLEQSFQTFRVADTHTDTVALYYPAPAPHVALTAKGQTRTVEIPAGQEYQRVFGETVVTTDAAGVWHLLRDGADTAVTGLPDGATDFSVEDADAADFILRYRSDEKTQFSIVNVATGAATRLPDRYDGSADDWEVSGFRLTPDSLLRLRTGRSSLDVYRRSDLSAPVRTVDNGSMAVYDNVLGLTGSTLLAVEPVHASSGDHRGRELWALPVDDPDASLTLVMNPAAGEITQLPDGSVLVAGAEKYLAEGDLDWGFYRIAQGPGATVTRTRVAEIAPAPARVYGLALGSGILTRATSGSYYHPGDQYGTYQSTWLATSGARDIVKSTVDGYVNGRDGNCSTDDGPRCVRMFADGTGFHGRTEGDYSNKTVLLANGSTAGGPSVDTKLSSPQLTDLSGRWGVVRSGTGGSPYLVDFSAATSTRQNATATAVWGSLVWNATETGQVTANNAETFTTRDDCAPAELQAVGRYVYYACSSSGGVYDRVTKGITPAPTGNVQLGDGFLAQSTDADGLKLVDLAGGAERVLVPAAELPMFSRPGYDWAVDRFGGGVAYVDATERVHVLDTGIRAGALTAIDSVLVEGRATWWLSKPAGSWQLTLRNAAGATVRTLSGSEARGSIAASWTDAGVAGWTLTAQPADGQGAALSLSGGTPPPAPANPPVKATKAPAISGTVAVGTTLRAATGSWTPAPTGYAYRWTANGVTIKGATSAYLPITAALLGKRLSVTVTASRAGHPSGTASSALTPAVAKGKAPRATTRPKITGTAKAGRKVTVSAGAWSPRADSYRYQWRVNGKLVGTGKTLKLTKSMRGKKLTVTVIARRAGHLDGRSTSKTVTVKR